MQMSTGEMPVALLCAMAILAMPEHGQGARGTSLLQVALRFLSLGSHRV
jgi:hypothetical protein